MAMILDFSLNQKIERRILEEEEKLEKKATNKLTASSLGWALQWQVLKGLGIPQKKKEIYTIKKFIRGRQVEKYLVDLLKIKETQKEVEYRNVLGMADALFEFDGFGKIPLEIKSIPNSKFKHLQLERKPDESHLLQAGLYALALKKTHFAVCYVASDDLRVMTFLEETKKVKEIIDTIIDEFEFYLEKKIVPCFRPRFLWQKEDKYNPYPEFKNLKPEQIKDLLKRKYGYYLD